MTLIVELIEPTPKSRMDIQMLCFPGTVESDKFLIECSMANAVGEMHIVISIGSASSNCSILNALVIKRNHCTTNPIGQSGKIPSFS